MKGLINACNAVAKCRKSKISDTCHRAGSKGPASGTIPESMMATVTLLLPFVIACASGTRLDRISHCSPDSGSPQAGVLPSDKGDFAAGSA